MGKITHLWYGKKMGKKDELRCKVCGVQSSLLSSLSGHLRAVILVISES